MRRHSKRFRAVTDKLKIDSPVALPEAVKILKGVKDRYGKFHAVTYNEDAIEFAVAPNSAAQPSCPTGVKVLAGGSLSSISATPLAAEYAILV